MSAPFSPANDGPSKTMTNAFYGSTQHFSSSKSSSKFPHLPQIHDDKWKWNNSKTALYYIMKLGQVRHHLIKEFFWTCFVTWGATGH